MLLIDVNLHIKTETVGYNNKILISNSKLNLGKNDNVNKDSKIKSHKVATATRAQKPTITHEEEKIASILSLTGTFTIWYMFC